MLWRDDNLEKLARIAAGTAGDGFIAAAGQKRLVLQRER
jgi:hypothetical protein